MGGPGSGGERARVTSGALLQLSVTVLWLGSFLLARLLEHAPHASLWFPPAAVTFAALLVVGARALPAVLVSCALATYLAELQYRSAVQPAMLAASASLFAIVHVAAYGLPAWWLRRRARPRPDDVTLRSVSRFVLLGMAGATLASVGGVAALSATGFIVSDAPGRLVAAWWLGDFVALLTLGPLLIRWMAWAVGAAGAHGASRYSPFQTDPTPASPWAAFKLAALVLATVAMLLAAHVVGERGLLLALLVVPLMLQLWIVHTENRTAALHGVVLFGLLTVGAGAWPDRGVDVVALQFAAIGLAANTYFGLAVPALYATNERLREQVTRDRLTRVLARGYFEDRVAEELERARAARRPAAVVLLDLDRLKTINDTHGHAVGDAVLVELASRCAAAMRPGDLFGRLSGDEFVVFLRDADATAAQAVVDRMRAAVESTPFSPPAGAVTASFGFAVTSPGQDGLAALLHAADQAMYRSKRGGVPLQDAGNASAH